MRYLLYVITERIISYNSISFLTSTSGIPSSDFTGDGVAFVLPLALPSTRNYRDGHTMMPAAIELYNISHGFKDDKGELLRYVCHLESISVGILNHLYRDNWHAILVFNRPQNRHWATVHRYNLGEIIYFNAFRYSVVGKHVTIPILRLPLAH